MLKASRLLGIGLLTYVVITLVIWKTWNSFNMCRNGPGEIPFIKTALFTRKENPTLPALRICKPHRKKNVDCRFLFRGDPEYVQKVKSMKEDKQPPIECTLENLIKNCSRFRQSHGYIEKRLSKQELDFPLAFTIKMHTAPYQMERLLRTIYMPHNFYCIHVDAKTDNKTYNLVKTLAGCLKNVVVLATRINVVYATSRHVKAELECMKRCKQSGVKWKYYINLTGQEFPLRTNLELVEILKLFKGANDIEAYKHPKSLNWRLTKKIKIEKEKLVKTNEVKKTFRYNIQIYKGSAYGMFSREFVEFMLNDTVANEIISWMNDTYSPEENIWSTLNSLTFAPGGYSGFETRHDTFTHASKAVIWAWDKVKCQGKLIRSVCVYGLADLPWLKSRPEIAANKFYEDIDSVVLDCLEESLRNRTNAPDLERLNWHYYRNLPQVKYYWKLTDSEKSQEFLEKKKSKWLAEHIIRPENTTRQNTVLDSKKNNTIINKTVENIAKKKENSKTEIRLLTNNTKFVNKKVDKNDLKNKEVINKNNKNSESQKNYMQKTNSTLKKNNNKTKT